MFYLIGLFHRAQTESKNPVLNAELFAPMRRQFEAVLRKGITEVDPVLVAEEENEVRLGSRTSIAKRVVDDLKLNGHGIDHLFCDPGKAARECRGILDEDEILSKIEEGDRSGCRRNKVKAYAYALAVHHPMREKFWLDRVRERIDLSKGVIFVCGQAHIEGFSGLIRRNGIAFHLLGGDIGTDRCPEEMELWRDAREFLEANPKIRDLKLSQLAAYGS